MEGFFLFSSLRLCLFSWGEFLTEFRYQGPGSCPKALNSVLHRGRSRRNASKVNALSAPAMRSRCFRCMMYSLTRHCPNLEMVCMVATDECLLCVSNHPEIHEPERLRSLKLLELEAVFAFGWLFPTVLSIPAITKLTIRNTRALPTPNVAAHISTITQPGLLAAKNYKLDFCDLSPSYASFVKWPETLVKNQVHWIRGDAEADPTKITFLLSELIPREAVAN
ncbi:hypothetical protein TWF718_001539 [Orbilia javanica]|uniref:Uncharacterized protein n=1 Tax=Orbilia javanica TaxID=47235 RepID=A0AAN8N9T6_9PEZI